MHVIFFSIHRVFSIRCSLLHRLSFIIYGIGYSLFSIAYGKVFRLSFIKGIRCSLLHGVSCSLLYKYNLFLGYL